jgi:hypothetical protein
MKWMQQLGRVLQKELVAATTQLLRRQEEEKGGQATEDVREAEARRQAERDQDLEGLSEEKRVKIEAKRKVCTTNKYIFSELCGVCVSI